MNLNWVPRSQLVQSIAINASIIQSIKLLQYAREELEAFVLEECQRNPLIELAGESEAATDHSAVSASKSRSELDSFRSGVSGMSGRGDGPATSLPSGDDSPRPENFVPDSVTLRDYLSSQRGSAFRDPVDLAIASHIIASLDEDGYLRMDLEPIADSSETSIERVDRVLSRIQEMDPPGVGARDLSECLRIQLKEKRLLTPELERLLNNLPLLATHKYQELASICGVCLESLKALVRQIKELDPRPGRRFDHTPLVPAIADVTVFLRDDGTLMTTLNSNALPRVLVNRQYYSEVRARCRGGDDIKFVTDCLKNANMLVRSLDQRAQTILKVATEIVVRQNDFLLRGIEHLKPLILKEVADAVGIHQSTVSRAVANKYIMTPVGLFELKYFFANSISAEGDRDARASEAVRYRIKQMIAEERAHAVLSDDAIVQELRREHVQIARRTVAKYRESMDIPSSHQRRRMRMAEMS